MNRVTTNDVKYFSLLFYYLKSELSIKFDKSDVDFLKI